MKTFKNKKTGTLAYYKDGVFKQGEILSTGDTKLKIVKEIKQEKIDS